jgi:hypothetical protein
MATAQQDAWMRRVLGAELAASEPAALDLQELSARLRAVRDDAALHGAATAFAADLRDAIGLLRDGDPKVVALVEALEQRVTEVARQARSRAAADTVAAGKTAGGAGVVEFAKLRLRLAMARGAFEEAVGNLKASFEALLETEDFVDDPRSRDPVTRAAIAGIDKKLPSFPDLANEVGDAIDRIAGSADPAQRSRHAQAALKAIERFKAEVRADPLLTEMESTDAGDFPIVATMVEALDGVAAALRV